MYILGPMATEMAATDTYKYMEIEYANISGCFTYHFGDTEYSDMQIDGI